jgi:hypothetical protein
VIAVITNAWGSDVAIYFTPAEFRRELDVSERTFKAYRKLGIVPRPAERRHRGYKGEIGLWTPAQVAQTRARLFEMRSQGRTAAVERLGHARSHRMVVADLYALAWRLVRAGPFGDRLRRIGCDLPLREIPPQRRALVRAELVRALAALGVAA